MKKLLMLLFVLYGFFNSNYAFASKWVLVTQSEDGNGWLIDAESVKKNNDGNVSAWIKEDYLKKPSIKISSIMYQYVYNCNNDTQRANYQIQYFLNGEHKTIGPQSYFSPIVPDTVASVLYAAVCKMD